MPLWVGIFLMLFYGALPLCLLIYLMTGGRTTAREWRYLPVYLVLGIVYRVTDRILGTVGRPVPLDISYRHFITGALLGLIAFAMLRKHHRR